MFANIVLFANHALPLLLQLNNGAILSMSQLYQNGHLLQIVVKVSWLKKLVIQENVIHGEISRCDKIQNWHYAVHSVHW